MANQTEQTSIYFSITEEMYIKITISRSKNDGKNTEKE